MATLNILSEIPGTVWKIEVGLGERIAADAIVVILESMKMEVPVQSATAGTVSAILVSTGDFVGEGEAVITLEV